jgi:hypothetical protein
MACWLQRSTVYQIMKCGFRAPSPHRDFAAQYLRRAHDLFHLDRATAFVTALVFLSTYPMRGHTFIMVNHHQILRAMEMEK